MNPVTAMDQDPAAAGPLLVGPAPGDLDHAMDRMTVIPEEMVADTVLETEVVLEMAITQERAAALVDTPEVAAKALVLMMEMEMAMEAAMATEVEMAGMPLAVMATASPNRSLCSATSRLAERSLSLCIWTAR